MSQTAQLVTVSARQKGWVLPDLVSFPTGPNDNLSEDTDLAMSLSGLSPFWIPRDEAVQNDVYLDGGCW